MTTVFAILTAPEFFLDNHKVFARRFAKDMATDRGYHQVGKLKACNIFGLRSKLQTIDPSSEQRRLDMIGSGFGQIAPGKIELIVENGIASLRNNVTNVTANFVAESLHKDVQAKHVWVDGGVAVQLSVLQFVDSASDDLVLQLGHQGIEVVVERTPKPWIFQPLESLTISRDIRRMKDEMPVAEQALLKVAKHLFKRADDIFFIDDDAAQHEYRILGVDKQQVMVTALIKEHSFCHLPGPNLIGRCLKRFLELDRSQR